MSMTRGEAIDLFEKQLTAAQAVLDSGFGSNPGENDILYRRRKEMAQIALTALRPVSREQVEKVLRGCDFCKKELDDYPYIVAHGDYSSSDTCYEPSFCPICGKPLTDEAVQMVMERLEALYDTES